MITEKIDAITKIDESHLGTSIPAPKSVKIELTGRCNFSCAFCARGQNLRDVADIDKVLFKRVLKEMRDEGVEEIGLFYLGESFMVPWLPEAIKYAKDIGYPYVFLTTNGSLATPKKVKECMEAGLDSLKFSYNYADGEQLKEIARVKTSYFDRIVTNMKEAARIRDDGGYKCGLYASYIEYDGEQQERMLDAVKEIESYMDQVYALPLYNQASLVTEEEKARGWAYTAGNRGRLEALRDPLPCWSAFTEGHITWDGRMSACCFDHNDNLTMGDLNEMSFMEAWNSDRFQTLRAAHLKKDIKGTACENCVAYA
jgi:radical SAM protein with 4Fe4S-binding SPASM domain